MRDLQSLALPLGHQTGGRNISVSTKLSSFGDFEKFGSQISRYKDTRNKKNARNNIQIYVSR
jgi:hypothetical protein